MLLLLLLILLLLLLFLLLLLLVSVNNYFKFLKKSKSLDHRLGRRDISLSLIIIIIYHDLFGKL